MKGQTVMETATGLKPGRFTVNPITLEVIRHGIVSITDPIDANIIRCRGRTGGARLRTQDRSSTRQFLR
jgi:hypothetical protein